MPNNRRLPRTARNSAGSIMPGFMGDTNHRYAPLGATVPTLPALEQPPAPKHVPFPNTPLDSDFTFELTIFLFNVLAGGLQFLHLYRTVWWLPNSYNNQALNFYLIDGCLVAFIVMLLSRRLIYILGCKLVEKVISPKVVDVGLVCFRGFLAGVVFTFLSGCTYCIIQSHAIMYMFYLCYPISVYLILFGIKIVPFFVSVNWCDNSLPPIHACSSTPSDIRQEVETLKTGFNNRMRQILFSSILNSYYAGFIPCCFAQSFLHYDVYWAAQHVLFLFWSNFVAYTTHILSMRYCDMLHRSALHLGNWDKLETRNMLLVNNIWNEDTLWPHGALVRYGRDVYRAQGVCNCSKPGCAAYTRFYTLFKNPSHSVKPLIGLHLLLIFWQLYLLVVSVFWYNILSLMFMLFFNYLLLYKILKDYFVVKYIYKLENMVHSKSNLH